MKIYNEDKTRLLEGYECDLSMGYLTLEHEVIYHDAIEEVKEEGHYEIVAEYPNGGQDVEWIIDTPATEGKDAWEETIEYQIYHLYTDAEIKIQRLEEQIEYAQKELNKSDFQAIKYAEGLYTEEQYTPIREARQILRNKINEARHEIERIQRETQEN